MMKNDGMRMGYNPVLFDLDGTLVESGPGIMNAVEYALKQLGVRCPPRQELRTFVGPPLRDSFMQVCGLTAEDAEEALRQYRVYYRKTGLYECEPYPGMEKLLHRLSGERTVVLATSKPEEFANQVLNYLGLRRYFSIVAGATFNEARTTKPEVLRYALDQCAGMPGTHPVMIGDRKFDVEAAKTLGVDSIGVLYGYGSREELLEAGATHLAQRTEELLDIIRNV